MKEDKKHDNGVHLIWTTSPGPARSTGRPSFIKWHEKEECTLQLQKGVVYLHTEKWPKWKTLLEKRTAPLRLWHREMLKPYKLCQNMTKWKFAPEKLLRSWFFPSIFTAHGSADWKIACLELHVCSSSTRVHWWLSLNMKRVGEFYKNSISGMVEDLNIVEEVRRSNPAPSHFT